MDTQQAREQFINNGYDAIPLKPQTKDPIAYNWQTQLTFTQWHNAPQDANIGLRAGAGHVFIDCDLTHNNSDPKTFSNITRWLDGLGYHKGDYPVVQTPSGGRHVYATITGALLGNWQKLNPTIGTGEFRYGPGAQVGTFPSVIDAGEYKLVSGDIARLPALDLQDICVLIDPSKATETARRPAMSATAKAMTQGKGLERYNGDRSAAECGLVLSLINSGFNYGEIKRIFDGRPCFDHYKNSPNLKDQADRDRWLNLTYRSALAFSQQESDTRKMLASLQDLARLAAWKNPSDRNLFIAHAKIGYKAGRFTYAAGVRDLALDAGVSTKTASAGNNRLMGQGFITKHSPARAVFATVYTLQADKALSRLSQDMDKPTHFLLETREEVLPFVPDGETIAQHDAFRNGKNRLGRRAGQMYQLLTRAPMTEKQLAQATGASIKTIRRKLTGKGKDCKGKPALSRIVDHKTGEIIEMVKREGDTWKAARVDLDLISAIMGTYGATGKQKAQYERDRREHARALELGKIKGE